MKRYLAPVFCCVLFSAGWIAIDVNAQATTARTHVERARLAAYEPGQDFTHEYDELCVEPRPSPPAAQPTAAPATPRIPPRSEWYEEPAKVFDNLYYVGSNNNSVWAVTRSAGIILIDADQDYAVEAEVVAGMKKMGLDPAQIKYVILTAGKPQIYGGTKYLQDHYNARALLSEADWSVIARANVPAGIKPKKDMVVTDGQKLTLGDVTVTLYVTPGHTPGTVSMLISPLKDGTQRHVGSVFGGRAPGYQGDGVQYFPSEVEGIRTWSASTKRYKEIVEKAGVEVFLSTHGSHDKTLDKLHALKFRKPGGPHAFVSKPAVGRFLTVIYECMDAQLAWRKSE